MLRAYRLKNYLLTHQDADLDEIFSKPANQAAWGVICAIPYWFNEIVFNEKLFTKIFNHPIVTNTIIDNQFNVEKILNNANLFKLICRTSLGILGQNNVFFQALRRNQRAIHQLVNDKELLAQAGKSENISKMLLANDPDTNAIPLAQIRFNNADLNALFYYSGSLWDNYFYLVNNNPKALKARWHSSVYNNNAEWNEWNNKYNNSWANWRKNLGCFDHVVWFYDPAEMVKQGLATKDEINIYTSSYFLYCVFINSNSNNALYQFFKYNLSGNSQYMWNGANGNTPNENDKEVLKTIPEDIKNIVFPDNTFPKLIDIADKAKPKADGVGDEYLMPVSIPHYNAIKHIERGARALFSSPYWIPTTQREYCEEWNEYYKDKPLYNNIDNKPLYSTLCSYMMDSNFGSNSEFNKTPHNTNYFRVIVEGKHFVKYLIEHMYWNYNLSGIKTIINYIPKLLFWYDNHKLNENRHNLLKTMFSPSLFLPHGDGNTCPGVFGSKNNEVNQFDVFWTQLGRTDASNHNEYINSIDDYYYYNGDKVTNTIINNPNMSIVEATQETEEQVKDRIYLYQFFKYWDALYDTNINIFNTLTGTNLAGSAFKIHFLDQISNATYNTYRIPWCFPRLLKKFFQHNSTFVDNLLNCFENDKDKAIDIGEENMRNMVLDNVASYTTLCTNRPNALVVLSKYAKKALKGWFGNENPGETILDRMYNTTACNTLKNYYQSAKAMLQYGNNFDWVLANRTDVIKDIAGNCNIPVPEDPMIMVALTEIEENTIKAFDNETIRNTIRDNVTNAALVRYCNIDSIRAKFINNEYGLFTHYTDETNGSEFTYPTFTRPEKGIIKILGIKKICDDILNTKPSIITEHLLANEKAVFATSHALDSHDINNKIVTDHYDIIMNDASLRRGYLRGIHGSYQIAKDATKVTNILTNTALLDEIADDEYSLFLYGLTFHENLNILLNNSGALDALLTKEHALKALFGTYTLGMSDPNAADDPKIIRNMRIYETINKVENASLLNKLLDKETVCAAMGKNENIAEAILMDNIQNALLQRNTSLQYLMNTQEFWKNISSADTNQPYKNGTEVHPNIKLWKKIITTEKLRIAMADQVVQNNLRLNDAVMKDMLNNTEHFKVKSNLSNGNNNNRYINGEGIWSNSALEPSACIVRLDNFNGSSGSCQYGHLQDKSHAVAQFSSGAYSGDQLPNRYMIGGMFIHVPSKVYNVNVYTVK